MKERDDSQGTASGSYRAVTDGDLRDAMDLREFLQGVGVVLQLPRRPTTASMRTVEEAPAPTRRTSRVMYVSLGLSLLAALALTLPRLTRERSDPVPSQLYGRWETRDPKYAERAFEVRTGMLLVQRGPNVKDLAVFPIQHVHVSPRGSRTMVDIQYDEDGAPQTLSLTVLAEGNAHVVHLRNQPDLRWFKRTAKAS